MLGCGLDLTEKVFAIGRSQQGRTNLLFIQIWFIKLQAQRYQLVAYTRSYIIHKEAKYNLLARKKSWTNIDVLETANHLAEHFDWFLQVCRKVQ